MSSGLHAYGRQGGAEISLLSEDEEHWELTVEVGRLSLAFPISSPAKIREPLDFLRMHRGATRSWRAEDGEFSGVPAGTTIYSMVAELELSNGVALRKDGESAERFVFAIHEGHRVFIDLLRDDVDGLIGALADLWAEWQSR